MVKFSVAKQIKKLSVRWGQLALKWNVYQQLVKFSSNSKCELMGPSQIIERHKIKMTFHEGDQKWPRMEDDLQIVKYPNNLLQILNFS